MGLKSTAFRCSKWTVRAGIWLLSCMGSYVNIEGAVVCRAVRTKRANIRFFSCVFAQVAFEVTTVCRSVWAKLASEGFLSCVSTDVGLQIGTDFSCVRAVWALISFLLTEALGMLIFWTLVLQHIRGNVFRQAPLAVVLLTMVAKQSTTSCVAKVRHIHLRVKWNQSLLALLWPAYN